MQYHPDDFLALTSAIEDEGGVLHPEKCDGDVYRIKQPDSNGDMVWRHLTTTHCGNRTRVGVPYWPEAPVDVTLELRDKDGREIAGEPIRIVHEGEAAPRAERAAEGKTAFVTVCAKDDAVGLWPRFREHVTDRSFQN